MKHHSENLKSGNIYEAKAALALGYVTINIAFGSTLASSTRPDSTYNPVDLDMAREIYEKEKDGKVFVITDDVDFDIRLLERVPFEVVPKDRQNSELAQSGVEDIAETHFSKQPLEGSET